MTSSTSVAFSIQTASATSQPQSNALSQSLWALGFVLFLGSAPATADGQSTAPSAVRPAALFSQTEAERRKSYRPSEAIESSITRLRTFGKYRDDWDSNGAVAPSQRAINAALQFVTLLEPWHPAPFATLSRSGEPVIEFEDASTGSFGSIRFLDDGSVELYAKAANEGSKFLPGELSSAEVKTFLSETMNLPTL